ncbi:exodeoxyribonuclease VII, small subunit [Idiomarina sp. A28L]|uniref:exodeoxyribonuclease VII small subunit n=1 Tax=Idiomarina sp. A28L TaxID=1036674 RepID=UPI00021385B9|nr:exodeoxyribonuclease VII small subunit [Idiomarina sp. A28L]EGN75205.1 exodeoxyribonuclease VII, small subunit [Idiomarina sp. A28L]
MSTKENTEALGFEQAMEELETIVSALEEGELPLEESLKQFERAVFLSRVSQQKLQQAEQKVQILLQQNGTESLEPFADLNTPTSE